MKVWVLQYDERDDWSRGPMVFATREAALEYAEHDSWWKTEGVTWDMVRVQLETTTQFIWPKEDSDESPFAIQLHCCNVIPDPDTTAFEPTAPSTKEIHTYREQHECSLFEAKAQVEKLCLLDALVDLRREGSLEDKVEWLLNRFESTIGKYQ